jgi:hypothetical protein
MNNTDKDENGTSQSDPRLDASPCSAFVVQHLDLENEWRDFTRHECVIEAQTCVANKRDKAGFRIIERTERIIQQNVHSPKNTAEVGIDVQRLVHPCCANCRWGMELEHRYDQVHCINEDSKEAFGDVEATFTCQLFEANS